MAKALFSSSEAKGYIRDDFNYNLIKQFKAEHYPNVELAYLGLPGESLLDVISWRGFIGRWTGVQAVGNAALDEAADNLVRNAIRQRLERGFSVVRGNIDLLMKDRSDKLKWPYQIVNLDYVGGFLGAKDRIAAIEAMFGQQVGVAFTLFITLNLRDRDKGELAQAVEDERSELSDLGVGGVDAYF